MTDPIRTLQRLDENPSPELWDDIVSRASTAAMPGVESMPAAVPGHRRVKASVAAGIAIVLAVGSFAVLSRAFSGGGDVGAGHPVVLIPSEQAGPPVLIEGTNIVGSSSRIGPHDYIGHVSVVTVWASSCAPCVRALPLLANLERADPSVTFLGIAERDDPSHLALFGRIPFPTVMDRSQTLTRALGVWDLPTYLVLDREGRIRYRAAGGPALPSGLQSAIAQLTQEPVRADSLLDPAQIAEEGFAAAFVSNAKDSWAAEDEFSCPSQSPHMPAMAMSLPGFDDAHLTGPPLPGPDPTDTSPTKGEPVDAHVPFAASKNGAAVKGSIEVVLGPSGRCVIAVGYVTDPPSTQPG
jgi:thiol-disulfide isomerase/thioredoxin